VINFSYHLESKGGSYEKIESVCSDMSGAYRSGIEYCFPYALHTIDKFHVKKLLLDGMDEVRRAEQKEHKSKTLHIGRKLLMVPDTKQSVTQREQTNALCKKYHRHFERGIKGNSL
jgi:transposase